MEIVNDYTVGPAFWAGLIAKGLDWEVDRDSAQYFNELYRLNQGRNRRLRRQLLEAVSAFQQVGIKTVLLKGAAQLIQPIHADIGCRIIGDLDILIEENQYALAVETLTHLGYQSDKVSYGPDMRHHYAPMFRSGDYGVVELHRYAVHLSVLPLLPTPDVWGHAQSVSIGGLKLLLPSSAHIILINLLHSQVVDENHYLRQFNLRALLDFAAIQKRYAGTIDWSSIRQVVKDNRIDTILDAYVLAASRLLNSSMVANNGAGSRAHLQYAISLAAVRWSFFDSFVRRLNAFSKEKIRHRYRCPGHRLSISAHQLRYLFDYLRERFLKAQ